MRATCCLAPSPLANPSPPRHCPARCRLPFGPNTGLAVLALWAHGSPPLPQLRMALELLCVWRAAVAPPGSLLVGQAVIPTLTLQSLLRVLSGVPHGVLSTASDCLVPQLQSVSPRWGRHGDLLGSYSACPAWLPLGPSLPLLWAPCYPTPAQVSPKHVGRFAGSHRPCTAIWG